MSRIQFIKAPTVLPTGIVVFGGYAQVLTDETTSSAPYVDLATVGPSVTVTVNTQVRVTISCNMYNAASAGAFSIGVALSGANTVAAADAKALRTPSILGSTASPGFGLTRVVYFSGLTPGSTTFTLKYGTTAVTTHFLNRSIQVDLLD